MNPDEITAWENTISGSSSGSSSLHHLPASIQHHQQQPLQRYPQSSPLRYFARGGGGGAAAAAAQFDPLMMMSNEASHYHEPRDLPTGLVSVSSSSGRHSRSENSDSTTSDAPMLLRSGAKGARGAGAARGERKVAPDPQTEYDKLDRSNRRLKTVFWVLVTLCSVVVVAYLVLIVALFVTLTSAGLDTSSSSSSADQSRGYEVPQGQKQGLGGRGGGRGGGDMGACVNESKIREFQKTWDPEDENDILKDSEFEYSSITKMYCFKSLQWVPDIMKKINDRVQGSVRYIEKQQTQINQTVNSYLSANRNDSLCSTQNSPNKMSPDPTNQRHSAVYAHFFADPHAKYTDSGLVAVKWIREGQQMSSRRNVVVSSAKGTFTIEHSGFYFVYTHMAFNSNDAPKSHRVMKTRGKDTSVKLLESLQKKETSYLQGVFQLNRGDVLQVLTTVSQLNTARSKASYFGLYLIRT